jgi:SAM-dependent methyltransferase
MDVNSRIRDFAWDLKSLPFVWTSLPNPSNGVGIPDELPFLLRIDPKSGTLQQVDNPLVVQALDAVYARGSVLSPMNDGSTIGKSYTDDYLSFIKSVLAQGFPGLKVLEIGAGTGYLAHRLQLQGADVIGIEPGEHGQDGARKYGLNIIKDYFPSPQLSGKFDLVTIHAVLEHVRDPARFIEAVKPYCHDRTRVALCVPDCQPNLERGDISILLHEHWQYFTSASMQNILTLCGARDIRIQKANFGGCLYASMALDGGRSGSTSKRAGLPPDALRTPVEQAYQFRAHAESVNEKLVNYLAAAGRQSESVGIYIPGRMINVLIATKVGYSHCRFFDDNEFAWGTYYPGINIPVESRKQLLANPPDRLLIMSLSFGNKIKSELLRLLPPRVAVTTLAELLDDSTPRSEAA